MKNQLKAGVILSYVISVMQIVIQLLYTPLILRVLGQSEYGLYTLIGSIVSYLSLCGLGFSSSYLRFYSRCIGENRKNEVAKLNGMYLTVYIIIASVSTILGTVLVLNCEKVVGTKILPSEMDTARILMAILVVNIAITFVNTIFDSIIIANESFIFQRVVRLLSIVANPILALPLLLMGFKSLALVVVTTVLSLGSLIINMFYCRKKIHAEFKFGYFDKALFGEILTFSVFIFINLIVDQINWNLDKLLLGHFWGTAAVAVYGVGSQLNNMDISISLSVSSVFGPRVNRYHAIGKADEEFSELFIKTGRIQCLIMMLLNSGLVFFGEQFISLWAGDGYKESYYVMLCLVLPAFIPCIQNIGLEMQRAKNMHQFRSIIYLLMSVINIIISIPLAKMYGAVGAAIGTTIGMLLGNGICMNWFYYKKMKLDIVRFWKNILKMFPPMIIPFAVGVFVNLAFKITTWYELIILCVFYTLVYVVAVWFGSMNEYEKSIIKSFIKPIS